MKKRILGLSLLALLTACGNNTTEKPTTSTDAPTEAPASESVKETADVSELVSGVYSNPVMVTTTSGTDFKTEVADPSVVRDPETGYFYCFSTDRVELFSEDGCNWTVYATGDNVINFPTWGQEVQPNKNVNLWAPDVVKIGDIWYYFYSLSGWGCCCGVGYGVADNIAGPYTDKGKLFSYSDIGIDNNIDPAVFVEENGDIYMTLGSFCGEFVVQLNQEDDGSITPFGGMDYQRENKTLIAGKISSWDGSTYEGGYIIKKDGYYYYFGSAGTCCEHKNSTYHVMVGKSKSILGPYVDSNGYKLTMSGSGQTKGNLVVWAGSSNEDVAGPGHNSVVMDDAGDYWIYYHGFSSKDNFGTRHLFMDKLLWNEAGFPYVNKMKPSFDTELDGPRLK